MIRQILHLLIIILSILHFGLKIFNTNDNNFESLKKEDFGNDFLNFAEMKHYKKHLFLSTDRDGEDGVVYIISIIDYLQYYNFKKYLETTFKTNFLPGFSGNISSVPPEIYSTRFIEYVKKISSTNKNKEL